uniref:BBI inhibitor n=1 Tax=Panagrolaimus sp. ES5 TaxID=591445 RepID=A0AC34G7C7_9BILA
MKLFIFVIVFASAFAVLNSLVLTKNADCKPCRSSNDCPADYRCHQTYECDSCANYCERKVCCLQNDTECKGDVCVICPLKMSKSESE